jgi:FAD/FMN-containing dehydrogenase
MGKYFGKSPVVVKPKTPEEIGKVMKYCYDNDIAVVPQGGNTGLVGKPVSLPGRVRQLIVRRLYTYTR